MFDIPPKVYKTYNVALTAEQKKLYLQLQEQHCTDNVVVDNGLKLYLRFQDICNGYEPVDGEEYLDKDGKPHHRVDLIPLKENPKLDVLEEIVDDIGSEQIVVWCSRAKLLYDGVERLRSLGYSVGIFDGKIEKKEREEFYEQFKRKEIQILFVNQASGAYGLDGLKKANYAIYLCSSYSVDRINRGVVSESKYIFDINCKGTCEDRVVEALKQGFELLDTGTTDSSVFLLDEEVA